MSDQAKLAEAMLRLAEAINALAVKMPNPGLGGLTVYHQHSYPAIPQPGWQYMDYRNPYFTGGAGGTTWDGGGGAGGTGAC